MQITVVIPTHNRLAQLKRVVATPPDFKMSPRVYWEQAMLEKQYRAMSMGQWSPTARQFYTGNASVKRQHILDTGGFDPRLRRAKDIDLAYRLAAGDALPSLKELVQGTHDRSAPVTFVRPETRNHYPAFQSKSGLLLASGCLPREQLDVVEAGARAFDQAFESAGSPLFHKVYSSRTEASPVP